LLAWGFPRQSDEWRHFVWCGSSLMLFCACSYSQHPAIIVMGDHKEQRVCVKCCFLLEKTAAETIVMLQHAFKDDAFGKSQFYDWFSHFKNGNMSVEDLP
jgi:hypothetical protein